MVNLMPRGWVWRGGGDTLNNSYNNDFTSKVDEGLRQKKIMYTQTDKFTIETSKHIYILMHRRTDT
mgnify:CR=1 FL=1